MELQRSVGNRGVVEILARLDRGRPVQRRPDDGSTDDAPSPAQVIGGITATVAGSILDVLQAFGLESAAVDAMVAMGVTSENDLTNLLFWAEHPSMTMRRIGPDQAELAAAWISIRNTVVRPALADRTGPGGEAKPARPSGKSPSVEPSAGGTELKGIGPERLKKYKTKEATGFRQEVYRRQLAHSKKRKVFYPGLPPGDVEAVEGGHVMHRSAAGDARALLAAARAALAADQAAGDPLALKVASVGIGSAYRDPERDFRAWKNAFNTHYNRTEDDRAALEGGPHGNAAINLMVRRMRKKKAVPGFSNHTKGLAIDFTTTQGKWRFGASSAQAAGWPKTWLHRWLVVNAAGYNFDPYKAEAWHWDHRGAQRE